MPVMFFLIHIDMKLQLFIQRLFICLLLLVSTSFFSFGQHSTHETVLKFTRQSNGNIASLNAVSQKVFSFSVEGLSTQQQVSDFVNKFQGKKFVVSVSISDVIQNTNQRKALIVFERATKIAVFSKLLKNAGISHIYVDNVRFAVSEIETVKTNVPAKTK